MAVIADDASRELKLAITTQIVKAVRGELQIVVDSFTARIAALESRLKEAETGGIKYAGVHQRANSETYKRGSVVTHQGSAWCAISDRPTGVPGASASWQLMVKGATK